MRSLRRRASVLVAVVLVSTCVVVAYDAAAQWDSNPLTGVETGQAYGTYYSCGQQDKPEGPIQGDVPKADQTSGRAQEGYNCGLAKVGYAKIFDGDPPSTPEARAAAPEKTGNANMAWIGHCAFVSGPSGAVAPESKPSPKPGAGVAVIDVSDPSAPEHVRTLHDPGTLSTSETIGAVTVGDRGILVIGQYGNDQVSDPKPMDVYVLSLQDGYRCADIQHIANPTDPTQATYLWPDNIHNLTISPDGRYVFATQPLQVLDISDLLNGGQAHYIGNVDDAMEGPMFAVGPYADYDDALPQPVREAQHPSYTSHEAWPEQVTVDGVTHTKLYLGAQLPVFELFTIVDITDWLQDPAHNKPDVISQKSGRGHSVRTATIKDASGAPHRYVLHSEESPFGAGFGCAPETANPFAGPSQPWLTNIDDEANPVLTSQFGLEINDPSNCQEQLSAGETDSVHYHDVDDPNDTHFVMASMWNAGLRIFDVGHDPAHPKEVAYFNPGDVDPTSAVHLDHAWGHVHYDKPTDTIWFATADGGFWVVRLEQDVETYLFNPLPASPPQNVPPASDPGWPGTAGVTYAAQLAYVDVTPYYCTLGTARGLNTPVPS